MTSRRIFLTDDKLERVLTAPAREELATELASDISAVVRATPQRRGFGRWLLGVNPFAARAMRPAMVLLAAAALLLAAAIAIAIVGARLQRPQLAGNGEIVFGSDRAGLTLIDPRTAQARSLVPGWTASASGRTDRDDLLAVSPRGDQLAYVVTEATRWSIIIVDVESGETVGRITGTADGIWPEWGIHWSHDGSKLVFAATLNGLATVAGADVRSGRVYAIGPSNGLSHDPAVSRSDGRIAFVAASHAFDPEFHIVVTADDGTSRTDVATTLPDGAHIEGAPDWAPDGRSLIFTIGSEDGRFALARVGDRGGDALVITPWMTEWISALWSPDGTQLLAMTSSQGGRSADAYTNGDQAAAIDVGKPDGSAWQRIVERGCANAVWAPDGRSIVFERGACEQPREDAQVVTIDVDGSNERVLWTGDARATARISIGWQSAPTAR